MNVKAYLSRLLAVALLSLAGLCFSTGPAAARSALFGGGPFYTGGPAVMNLLRSSGFNTIILWSIHVRSNGDLYLNDTLVVTNGSYVGNPSWPDQLLTLKQKPTSVDRIEVSIGSWGVRDFETIKSLIESQGIGPDSILFRNFQALKIATGADAADFDDESAYDLNATTSFGNMLSGLGYKITLCPYTRYDFWASVKSNLSSKVDRVYLQAYAGGAGNDPAVWNTALGMTVDPGLWSLNGSGCSDGDNPTSVQNKMREWKSSAGVVGGFIWLFDDIQGCSSQGTAAQYAAAINTALGGKTTGVTLYPDINLGSSTKWSLAKGTYAMSELEAKSVRHDLASSIKIQTIASGHE